MTKKRAITNEEDLRQAEIDNNFTAKDRVEVLCWVLANKLGRKFIWWLLSEGKIFSSSLGQHHEMAFNEGKKYMALQVFQLIQADSRNRELFALMQDENINRG